MRIPIGRMSPGQWPRCANSHLRMLPMLPQNSGGWSSASSIRHFIGAGVSLHLTIFLTIFQCGISRTRLDSLMTCLDPSQRKIFPSDVKPKKICRTPARIARIRLFEYAQLLKLFLVAVGYVHWERSTTYIYRGFSRRTENMMSSTLPGCTQSMCPDWK
ncbi:hypothetical protein B0H12DRAFT_815400 [Mycena haematopus]|nr:hypothetical protein B0H12DRAFT_815400 [Mycena haematopus]